MEATEFIWVDGKFVPWADAKIHVLTHTLHYGGGTFEGLRCYHTDHGPAIFRLKEHTARLMHSAKVIKMNVPFTAEEISAATVELVRKNKVEACYIRPIIYYGYGKMGLNPKGAPVSVSIACWPWGAYLPYESVNVKTSSFIRIHPKTSYSDAKICGHYVNSIVAVQELDGTDYHEALLLDYEGNIAEGPGENLFIIKDSILYTPKLGSILPGITRDAVIQLATHFQIKIVQKSLKLEDAYAADEAFFTGTAAEVTPVHSIDDKLIGDGKVGPMTKKIKDAFMEIVTGKDRNFLHFLTFVNAQ